MKINGVWLVIVGGEKSTFTKKPLAENSVKNMHFAAPSGDVGAKVVWDNPTKGIIVDTLDNDHGTVKFLPLFDHVTQLD